MCMVLGGLGWQRSFRGRAWGLRLCFHLYGILYGGAYCLDGTSLECPIAEVFELEDQV